MGYNNLKNKTQVLKMKKLLSIFILSTLSVFLVAPFFVFAAGGTLETPPTPTGINVATIMSSLFNPIWQLCAGLAVIMFVVAGILFITSSGEPGKITTARNAVIWGVVGIVVATVAFSIVQIASSWV